MVQTLSNSPDRGGISPRPGVAHMGTAPPPVGVPLSEEGSGLAWHIHMWSRTRGIVLLPNGGPGCA